jgi:hypothetical protein
LSSAKLPKYENDIPRYFSYEDEKIPTSDRRILAENQILKMKEDKMSDKTEDKKREEESDLKAVANYIIDFRPLMLTKKVE